MQYADEVSLREVQFKAQQRFSNIYFHGKHCSLVGEGNGTRLQYFCLENPMDGGAWWAAVHGVARVGHN